MVAQPKVITAGHGQAYFDKDDYFTRSGEAQWFGKLALFYGLPTKIDSETFQKTFQENEKTQSLNFRFKVFDHLYEDFTDPIFREKVLGIQKAAIEETLDFVKKKYPKLNFTIHYDPSQKKRVYKFEIEEKKGKLCNSIKSTDLAKKNCSFYERVTKDQSIFRFYNKAFSKKLKGSGISIHNDDLLKKNGSVSICRGRIGIDLPFNLPKSLSIAAFAHNRKYYDEIMDCHHRAVKAALTFIEKEMIYFQKTVKGEKVLEKAKNGMLCAIIDHFTSRNLEPHIHSHSIIFSNIRNNEGKELRMENYMIFKMQMLAGMHYRTALSRILEENGFQIQVKNQKNHFIELKGFTDEMIMSFSSRRREILDELKKMGIEGPNAKIADLACRLTRNAKIEMDLDLLVESWQNDFKKLGIDDIDIKGDHFEATDSKKSSQATAEEKEIFHLNLVKELTESEGGFTEFEFYYFAMRDGSELRVSMEEAQHYLNKFHQNGIVLSSVIEDSIYYYTKEAAEMELDVFDRIIKGRDSFSGIDPEILEYYISTLPQRHNVTFTDDQVNAIRFFSNSDRYFCIQGDAGTGKTKLLREINHIFSSEGFSVKGICFSGMGAQNIFNEARIESTTIHKHLNNLEYLAGNFSPNQDFFNKKAWDFSGLEKPKKPEIWLVDESSMISNRIMDNLTKAAEMRDARVVFVGDFKQLQAVGAGAVFTRLINNKLVGVVELKENVRHSRTAQKHLLDAIEAAAKGFDSNSLKKGDFMSVYNSISNLRENITQVPDVKTGYRTVDRTPRLNRIVKDFMNLDPHQRANTFIITSQNNDREFFNEKIRLEMKTKGELTDGKLCEVLGKDKISHIREFSVGDKVVFLNNSLIYDVQVRNGSIGTVTGYSDNALHIKVGDEIIEVDLSNYNYLDHAYSITVHKSQGTTIPEKVFFSVDINQKWSNYLNSYYVALTRSNADIQIYTNGTPEEMAVLLSKKQYKFSILDIRNEERFLDEFEPDWSQMDQEFEDPDAQFSFSE